MLIHRALKSARFRRQNPILLDMVIGKKMVGVLTFSKAIRAKRTIPLVLRAIVATKIEKIDPLKSSMQNIRVTVTR